MPTLYELLEVSEQATPDELRRAYRRLVLLTHPDRTPDTAAHQRYLVVNEAYEILSQPARRQAYDALLQRQRQPVAPPARPTPAHAAPSPRRRPPVRAQQARRARPSSEVDLRPYNRPALLWCRVLMGLGLLVLVDYFFLVRTVHTEPLRLSSYRTDTGAFLYTVVTKYGSFSTHQEFPAAFPPLELQTSWLFRFVHQAHLPDGSRLPLVFSYGSMMSFTGLLLLLTAIAQIPSLGPAVRVNLAIIAAVLGLIVVLMGLVAG
jgi:hypothetical protein